MKITLSLILIVFSFSICSAQVEKGNFLMGGSISFQTSKYTEGGNRTTTFLAMPNAGYFFIDKLAGGIKSSFSYTSNDGDSQLDIFAGPFARYYFLPLQKKINLLLEGNFMIGTEKYQNFDAEGKTEYGAAAGPAFFINRNIAIEATINWRSRKYKTDAGRYNTFGMAIGFQIHLDRKKKEGK